MDFKLTNPFVRVKKNKRISKWQNSGTALASLIPYRTGVKLRHTLEHGYGVFSVKKTGGLHLIFELRTLAEGADVMPEGSTLALVLVLGRPPPKVQMEPVTGVKIDWDDTAESAKIGVIIQTRHGEPPLVHVTRKDVRVVIEDKVHTGKYNLHHPGYYLSRVLMVDGLPELSRIEPYLK